MPRKLAIDNKVLVPVKIVAPNMKGRKDEFRFHLICDRLDEARREMERIRTFIEPNRAEHAERR